MILSDVYFKVRILREIYYVKYVRTEKILDCKRIAAQLVTLQVT